MPQAMNDGGPVEGMSLRDWFAGQVIAGGWIERSKLNDPLTIAKSAYTMADGMLIARQTPPPTLSEFMEIVKEIQRKQ